MSLRALVEEHDEADIIIDASAPLIHSIVAWAETTGSGRHLLFKTENSEYYASVRSSLKARGWRVADFEGASTKQRKSLPVLVYEETTEDSVNSIESLLRKNEVDAAQVCALLDSVSGVDELRRLGSRLPPARSVSHVQCGDLLRLLYARAPRDSSGDAYADHTRSSTTRRAPRLFKAGLSFIRLPTGLLLFLLLLFGTSRRRQRRVALRLSSFLLFLLGTSDHRSSASSSARN